MTPARLADRAGRGEQRPYKRWHWRGAVVRGGWRAAMVGGRLAGWRQAILVRQEVT